MTMQTAQWIALLINAASAAGNLLMMRRWSRARRNLDAALRMFDQSMPQAVRDAARKP
jgi:hypothetical protein